MIFSTIQGLNHDSYKRKFKFFRNVAEFKYLETTVRNHSYINKQVKSRLNFGTVYYHSVQRLLNFRPLI